MAAWGRPRFGLPVPKSLNPEAVRQDLSDKKSFNRHGNCLAEGRQLPSSPTSRPPSHSGFRYRLSMCSRPLRAPGHRNASEFSRIIYSPRASANMRLFAAAKPMLWPRRIKRTCGNLMGQHQLRTVRRSVVGDNYFEAQLFAAQPGAFSLKRLQAASQDLTCIEGDDHHRNAAAYPRGWLRRTSGVRQGRRQLYTSPSALTFSFRL